MYRLGWPTMSIRADVYSPVQNTAVWLAAWLYGYESSDATIDALQELGGTNTLEGTAIIELLSGLRAATSEILTEPEPVLKLVLAGPGEPPALPVTGESAQNLVRDPAPGAIVVKDNDPELHHVLIPRYFNGTTEWTWIRETLPLPATSGLLAGDADYYLSQATNTAAELIEKSGHAPADLPNARMTIGTLADFYDIPGLPGSVPPRVAKLFARTDTVAATIEMLTDKLGDHSLDAYLFGLFRHLRHARMAGVARACAEFARSWR